MDGPSIFQNLWKKCIAREPEFLSTWVREAVVPGGFQKIWEIALISPSESTARAWMIARWSSEHWQAWWAIRFLSNWIVCFPSRKKNPQNNWGRPSPSAESQSSRFKINLKRDISAQANLVTLSLQKYLCPAQTKLNRLQQQCSQHLQQQINRWILILQTPQEHFPMDWGKNWTQRTQLFWTIVTREWNIWLEWSFRKWEPTMELPAMGLPFRVHWKQKSFPPQTHHQRLKKAGSNLQVWFSTIRIFSNLLEEKSPMSLVRNMVKSIHSNVAFGSLWILTFW